MARSVIWAMVAWAALGIMPASGQDVTSPYPSFTFKRIKAPKSDGSRRITVQIDPAEQAARLASTVALLDHPVPDKKDWTERVPANRAISDTGLPATAPGSYSWYWDMVSPKIGDSSGRFSLALSALAQGPGGKNVAAPRLQSLQDIAAVHGQDILAATVGTRVSPALVVAVISVESAGRADAVSPAGAKGLMQLISATADRFDVDDRADPVQNIKGGVAYLDWLMREFNDDPLMAIAAYNAGENAVKGAGGVPAYAETRDYVPKVLAAWAVARGLCVTPPELVSDGCVFAVKG